MRTDDGDKIDRRVIAVIILWLLAMLVVTGCRSRRTVERKTYHSTEAFEVKRDTVHRLTKSTDNLTHVWDRTKVITYRSDGTKEREEIKEKHKEDKQSTKEDEADSASSQANATVAKNATVEKDVVVDATPAVKTSRNWAWIVWGVVILTCIIATWLLYAKYKRVGRVL